MPVGVKMGIGVLLRIFAGLLFVSGVSCESHSLRYFYTALSDPQPGAPAFYTVGYVDEIPFDWYDSNSQQYQLKAKWMTKVEAEDPQYREQQSQIARGSQQVFKANVKTVMDRYNQTGGMHVVQYMYGCELDQDGSIQGFRQYAYDGHDFISLDKDRQIWVPAVREAEITEQKWNADRNLAERDKGYLEQTCIEWLQKYVRYGAEELNNKVRPSVKLWSGKARGHPEETLHCQVTGFYPRDIEVKWVKNGEVTLQGTAAKDILPNHDGTYQTWESVEIDPQEKATYSCHVDHGSLLESLDVLWKPEPWSSLIIGVIVGVIVGVMVAVILGVTGFFIWKKNQRGGKGHGYSEAAKEDRSSTSSGAQPDPAI